ncbi:MAG TPA: permease [Spirochaetales bacterium]|nr:permease [Spirochaetales bacterium]
MTSTLSQPLLFLFIILLANMLKRAGMFSTKDGQVLSQITLNITLPAAIISGFQSFELVPSLFLLILVGIAANAILMGIAYLMMRKESKSMQGYAIFNTPTYNIGNFTFPFVQALYGGPGLVVASLFDLGNALMTTGFVYSVGSSVATDQRPSIKDILKKLFQSVPFLSYLLMILLSLFGLRLPTFLNQWMSAIGKANPIVAMLMIGIMLDVHFEKGWMKQAMKVISVRYLTAIVFSVLIWTLTSWEPMVKVILTLLLFSPVASVSTAYTQQCTDKGKLSSFTSSVTVVISTICYILLVPLLGA